VVRAIVVASAFVAVLAPSSPTGLEVVDACYRAGYGAAAAWAGARSRRWAWIVAAGLAAAFAQRLSEQVVGFGLLGLAVGTTDARRRGPMLGAVLGAATAQVLLRLGTTGRHGVTALAAAAALVVLVVSGYRQGRRKERVWARRGAFVVAGVALTLGGLYAVAALEARPLLTAGVRNGERGLTAARSGDSVGAAQVLAAAADQLAGGNARLGKWWAQPARLLPVVSQHAKALDEVSAALAGVARPASAVAAAAGGIGVRSGAVDLVAVMALQEPLAASVAALESALGRMGDLGSPWLVGALDRRLDRAASQLGRALEDGRMAAQAVEVVPGLLGRDGPRRYFLAIQTPAEQRASGGFMGNFAELLLADGRMTLPRVGDVAELGAPDAVGRRQLQGQEEYQARYGRFGPERFFGNASLTPDFPTAANVFEQLYPQSGGTPVSGVLAVDPVALAALLQLTGPVTVADWPVPLDAANTASILLHEEYLRLEGDARNRFLIGAAQAIFDKLTSVDLPGPGELARVLGPMARGRHLQLYSPRVEEQAFFRSIDAAGAMAPVVDDYLQVVTQNGSQNKIDWFQRRDVSYDVRYTPETGEIGSIVRLRLTNDAPASGLPDYVIGGTPGFSPGPGISRLWVSVYTPLGLVGATLDGRPVVPVRETELGRVVYSQFVDVGPGASATLELSLSGRIDPGRQYRLDVGRQPTITPDNLSVRVGGADGWIVTSATELGLDEGDATRKGPQSSNMAFAVTFGSRDGRAQGSGQSGVDR